MNEPIKCVCRRRRRRQRRQMYSNLIVTISVALTSYQIHLDCHKTMRWGATEDRTAVLCSACDAHCRQKCWKGYRFGTNKRKCLYSRLYAEWISLFHLQLRGFPFLRFHLRLLLLFFFHSYLGFGQRERAQRTTASKTCNTRRTRAQIYRIICYRIFCSIYSMLLLFLFLLSLCVRARACVHVCWCCEWRHEMELVQP